MIAIENYPLNANCLPLFQTICSIFLNLMPHVRILIPSLLDLSLSTRFKLHVCFILLEKNFQFCAHRFGLNLEDVNLLTRPEVIVDWYY
jgi:hypothetical protein